MSLVASIFVEGLSFFYDQRRVMDGYLPSLKIADGSLVPRFG